MTGAPPGADPAVDAARRDAVIDMLAAAVGRGETVVLGLEGHSMRPHLVPGARLHVGRARRSDLRLGDLVVYRAGDRLVCHRLLLISRATGAWRALTSGDAHPHAVTWVEGADVLGRVVAVEAAALQRLDTPPARLAAWACIARALGAIARVRIAARLRLCTAPRLTGVA